MKLNSNKILILFLANFVITSYCQAPAKKADAKSTAPTASIKPVIRSNVPKKFESIKKEVSSDLKTISNPLAKKASETKRRISERAKSILLKKPQTPVGLGFSGEAPELYKCVYYVSADGVVNPEGTIGARVRKVDTKDGKKFVLDEDIKDLTADEWGFPVEITIAKGTPVEYAYSVSDLKLINCKKASGTSEACSSDDQAYVEYDKKCTNELGGGPVFGIKGTECHDYMCQH